MPHSPPLPIGATFSIATTTLRVTFDRPLQPAVLHPGNWRIRETNQVHTGLAPCTAAGSLVTCGMSAGIANLGPDIVDYLPPPFDVLSVPGVAAAGFTDFPLTLLP